MTTRSRLAAELERRLRRFDPTARLMVEAHRIVAGDVKRRREQFLAADSTAGLDILIPPEYGVTLAGSASTLVAHAVAGDGYLSDLGTTSPYLCCRAAFDGVALLPVLWRRITARLNPDTGAGQNVATWRCELWLATQDDPAAGEWVQLGTPVDVTAGPSEADVSFDFLAQKILPALAAVQLGVTQPKVYIVIKALQLDGTSATNVGWRRDSTTASVTGTGVTIQARQVTVQSDGRLLDENLTMTPVVTIERQAGFTTTDLTFTTNKPTLGVQPDASEVVFTIRGEIPVGCAITGYARVLGTDPWTEVADGETAADVGLAVPADGSYQMRATLATNATTDLAPTLTDLGVEQVERTDLSHVAMVTGGGWGFDPVTLKGKVAEVTIVGVQDGERDFRDAMTTLLSTTHIGDLWFRVYVMADDLSRDDWYHVDDFYPDHTEGLGGALVVRAINVLGMLKQALPKYDIALQQRTKLTYTNQTKKAVFADLIQNQLALADRYIGPMVEAEAAIDLVSKEIIDADGKEELDAVAFLAGATVQGAQGRVVVRDVHGAQAPIAYFGIEELAQETVTPGWSQAVPSFFADYGYDNTAKQFRRQHRGFNVEAATKLGQRALDRVEFLDATIAQWIPSGPTGDLARYVEPVVERQIATLGTGMITVDFRSTMPYPEVWPGDVVAVRTDRFVARSPTDDRAITGYVWMLGVVCERRDVWGTAFRVWVRRYSDILPGSNTVTLDDDLVVGWVAYTGVIGDESVHLWWGKFGAPAVGNPLYKIVLDDSAPPKTVFVGDDGTTVKELLELDYATQTVTVWGQLVSTLTTGTAPLSVASQTLVTNLNADLLDGLHASAFSQVGHTHVVADLTDGATLSRTNDTNVTLTLGGTPSQALIRAASLTLGWQNRLSVARGGMGGTGSWNAGGMFYASGATTITDTGAGAIGSIVWNIDGTSWTQLQPPAAGVYFLQSDARVLSWSGIPAHDFDIHTGDLDLADIGGAVPQSIMRTTAAGTAWEAYAGSVVGRVLKLTSAAPNAVWAEGQVAANEISGGAALSRTNDTNVTVTLGGSPTTALLAAASLTMGWSGQLSVARGGTAHSSWTAGGVVYASGATTLTDSGAGGMGSILYQPDDTNWDGLQPPVSGTYHLRSVNRLLGWSDTVPAHTFDSHTGSLSLSNIGGATPQAILRTTAAGTAWEAYAGTTVGRFLKLTSASPNAVWAESQITAADVLAGTFSGLFTFSGALTAGAGITATPSVVATRADSDADMTIRRTGTGVAGAVIGGVDYSGVDSLGNQKLFGRLRVLTAVITSGSEEGRVLWMLLSGGVEAARMYLDGAALYPATAGGLTLGAVGNAWGAAYLGALTATDAELSGNLEVAGQAYSPINASSISGNTTVNWDNGNVQKVTITGGTPVLTLSNLQAGGCYTLWVQASGGSRTFSIGNTIQWVPAAPDFTLATDACQVLTFLYDGTNILGFASAEKVVPV